ERYLDEHPGQAALNDPRRRYLPIYLISRLVLEHPHGPENADDLLPPKTLWTENFSDIDIGQLVSWVKEHRLDEISYESHVVRLGVQYSFQDWMVETWMGEIGNETEDLLRSLNLPA